MSTGSRREGIPSSSSASRKMSSQLLGKEKDLKGEEAIIVYEKMRARFRGRGR